MTQESDNIFPIADNVTKDMDMGVCEKDAICASNSTYINTHSKVHTRFPC